MKSNQVFRIQKCFAITLLSACILGMLLLGCQTASERQTKNQKKIDAALWALEDNQNLQIKEASKQIYASGVAIRQVTPKSPATQIASEFNSMAQTTLGYPNVEDKTVLKGMIMGLLSTNQSLRAAAEAQKHGLQEDIAALQTQKEELQVKLEKAESRRDEDYARAAAKAESYDKWRRRIYWTVGIIAGGLGLSLILPALSLAFPALAPFSAIFTGVFGRIGKMIFRIAPQAMTSAGVVGQQSYELTERTLADVVKAISEVKKKNQTGFETVLESELKNSTDPLTSRKKIQEIHERLERLAPAKTPLK